MYILNYLLGSYYIMRSIFRISEKITKYMFDKDILNLPIYKFEKINECIFSSIHGIVVSTMASFSIRKHIFNYYLIYDNDIDYKEEDNKMQYLTTSFCLSYFVIDLFKCLYQKKYLFIIHHIAAINLLILSIYSFYNNENKGFYSMYLIFLLESNTFLLNIGFLLKEFNFHYSITCFSWIIHLFLFVVFRLITIPRILFIYYYNEPLTFINIYQIPSFILILSGSIYWAYRQTIGIHKYLKENSVI